LLAVSERVPRTRTWSAAPGALLVGAMSTPGTRPRMASTALGVGIWAISDPLTEATEPVTSRRLCVP
jgi:hypothetical protein